MPVILAVTAMYSYVACHVRLTAEPGSSIIRPACLFICACAECAMPKIQSCIDRSKSCLASSEQFTVMEMHVSMKGMI
jgi:hypothetical protein